MRGEREERERREREERERERTRLKTQNHVGCEGVCGRRRTRWIPRGFRGRVHKGLDQLEDWSQVSPGGGWG